MTYNPAFSPPFMARNRSVLVVGRNAAATAVVDSLAQVPGVGTVRQMGSFDPMTDMPRLMGVDVVVDMLGGLSPAFALAMATLSSGVAFVTSNPLLMMVHGRVLRNAAAGQGAYVGFQAAGFGLPLAELLGAARPERLVACFSTAASEALARMNFRNESLAHVSAHLKMQNVDLSDWGGKQTLARGLAVHTLMFDSDMPPAAMQRVSVEHVDAADTKRLSAFGLRLVFGADMTEQEIYAGPMAVAEDSPLLQTRAHDVLVAETAHGDIVLRQEADEARRLVAGVTADVRALVRSPKPALPVRRPYDYAMPQPAGVLEMAYVRVPFAAKEAVLAHKPEVMQDAVDGDGLWQAVVAVPRVRELDVMAQGGMVYPLASAWQPRVAQVAGLRLVG